MQFHGAFEVMETLASLSGRYSADRHVSCRYHSLPDRKDRKSENYKRTIL